MPIKIPARFLLIRNERNGEEKWIDERTWPEHEKGVWSRIKTYSVREGPDSVPVRETRNGVKHIPVPETYPHVADPKVFSAKLYRKEWKTESGKETTDIKFESKKDGAIVIDGCDMGPSVEEWFGDWDYEYSMTVGKDDIPRFLYLVLKEAFSSSRPLTYGTLRRMCKANAIESNPFSWS